MLKTRLSWVVRRGDITKDSAEEVARLVTYADPDEECIVIWAGAPPCQNFSIIASRQGHEGETGKLCRLFLSSVNLMGDIKFKVAPRLFGHINRGHAHVRRGEGLRAP